MTSPSSLTTAYTFSKGLNYADDNGGLGIPINFKMNYGRMGQDRPHMWVQSLIYDTPFGPGKRWLSSGWTGKLLGGWQLSGAFYTYSGTPMTFSYSSTTLNAPGNSQRANINGKPAILGNIGPGQKWFDTSVFSIPAPATFGNAGRNTLSGPGFWSLDMSVVKKFVMTEPFRAEIRLELSTLPTPRTSTTRAPRSIRPHSGRSPARSESGRCRERSASDDDEDGRGARGAERPARDPVQHRAQGRVRPRPVPPRAGRWCRLCKAKVTPPRWPSENDIEDTRRDHLPALVARWMDDVEKTLAKHSCDMAFAPAGLM